MVFNETTYRLLNSTYNMNLRIHRILWVDRGMES